MARYAYSIHFPLGSCTNLRAASNALALYLLLSSGSARLISLTASSVICSVPFPLTALIAASIATLKAARCAACTTLFFQSCRSDSFLALSKFISLSFVPILRRLLILFIAQIPVCGIFSHKATFCPMWARTGCATEHGRGALTGDRAWTLSIDRRGVLLYPVSIGLKRPPTVTRQQNNFEKGRRLKNKIFNPEICVCAHLTQTRHAQKTCAEMRGRDERYNVFIC